MMPRSGPSAASHERLFVIAFAAVLMAGVMVNWSTGVWAVSVVQAGVLLVAISWIVGAAIGQWPIRLTALIVPISLLSVWGLVQLAAGATVYRFETWVAVLYWLTNAAAFFVCAQILGRRDSRELFATILLVFGSVLALITIVQLYTTPDRVYGIFPTPFGIYAAGPFLYRNQYAAFIELLLPLALYRAVREPAGALAYSAIAALLFASVIATASRGGTLFLALEIVAFSIICAIRGLVRRKAMITLLLTLTGLVVVFTAIAGWQIVWERLREQQYGQRTNLVRSTLAMIRERPLAGSGLGTWRTTYPAYATFDDGLLVNEAHNDWAQWAAEGGVPFALLILAIFVMSLPRVWRSPWGLGVAVVFVHCLIDYPTREPVVGAVLFSFLGALAAAPGNDGGRRTAAAA